KVRRPTATGLLGRKGEQEADETKRRAGRSDRRPVVPQETRRAAADGGEEIDESQSERAQGPLDVSGDDIDEDEVEREMEPAAVEEGGGDETPNLAIPHAASLERARIEKRREKFRGVVEIPRHRDEHDGVQDDEKEGHDSGAVDLRCRPFLGRPRALGRVDHGASLPESLNETSILTRARAEDERAREPVSCTAADAEKRKRKGAELTAEDTENSPQTTQGRKRRGRTHRKGRIEE